MLTKEEKDVIQNKIKRDLSLAEESVIDALWSEHCSYKSSKRWFHLFNTESRRVFLGIGEGAGLIDVGDDYVIGLGIESHNHPSAVDPFNGAATGVGGIIRDILSQGCKPIAILDCLRFAPPVSSRQKLLLDQVVLGISSYGNCVGVPNLGGDMEFSDEFEGNPLVNAMCVGVAKKDEIIRSIASNPGDVLLLYGASTGKDGIGGVTFASEELVDETQDESRGSVQIGDPLMEKLLIDVTLELRDENLLEGLQDLGGGGLACAAIEMSEKGETGLFIDLNKIHLRDESMKPWEILISESQERMLGIVNPDNVDTALGIIKKYGLEGHIIGRIEEGETFIGGYFETIEAELPVNFVINGFPEPKRELIELEKINPSRPDLIPEKHPLLELLGSVNLASRKPIFQQYDQHVQGNTVMSPGFDAGVVKLPNDKYLAVAAGTNSYLISSDPKIGGALATLCVIRSVIARGAEPIAMVDSLNAGNPEKASSYTEFVEMIKGVAEVSHAFKIPVVGGNVSLYNEAELGGETHKILSSAFIGIAGLIESKETMIRDKLKNTNSKIYLLGAEEGFLHGSEYHRRFGGETEYMNVNYDLELQVANIIYSTSKLITSATDIGRGGLLVTLSKWAISSNVGLEMVFETDDLSFLYGEYGARYLVQIDSKKEKQFLTELMKHDVEISVVARTTTAKSFKLDDNNMWDLRELRKLWEAPLQQALHS
ncbi:MAG: phosphoribosylformylglycinamidine synthase subunit PurL [Candidatus Heimdallarchaeota archaeon]|nr:phosphoribosylformylglycinamidine synthase subunit PurL [Candidatus Heimdallarchaeota archaeon]